MENDLIELTCLSCGQKLQIANEFEMLVICKKCNTEFVVNRGIGVMSLVPFVKRHRAEVDYVRDKAEADIRKLSEEIQILRERLSKQVSWIRARKKEERIWLHGVFAGWRVRGRQETEVATKEAAHNDNLSELDILTSSNAEELIGYFMRLAGHYPNDRRVRNLMAVFQNMKLILGEIELKNHEIESRLLLLK